MQSEPVNCVRCHLFRGVGADDDAPVLTGWGSREWMMGMIHDPTQDDYYGDNNDRMPSFGADEDLSEAEIGLVVDWLRGDWYEAPDGR
ncbi:MAG: hypothetical protein HKO77_01980 [Gemmatimonadetes bacterium]|nr:hypothetical protein [Gemmatimonadota bacterium]